MVVPNYSKSRTWAVFDTRIECDILPRIKSARRISPVPFAYKSGAQNAAGIKTLRSGLFAKVYLFLRWRRGS